MATSQNHSRQMPVPGNNDSNNSTVPCKTCGKIDLEGDDSNSNVDWVTCDRCKLWEHQLCAGIVPPRSKIPRYWCATCKKPQWTPTDSEKMWSYIERTVDGVIGKEGKSTWFENMKKEIGAPYSDSTFKRHFKKEMEEFISDGAKDMKKRIKYAFCWKISCPLEVLDEFKSRGNVAHTWSGKLLAFTENGSTEPLYAAKNWKSKRMTVGTLMTTLPGPIPIVVNVTPSYPGPNPKVGTLKLTDMSSLPQSSTDCMLALAGAAIRRQAEQNQEEEGEAMEVEEQDHPLQPRDIKTEFKDQFENVVSSSTSSDRYSVPPHTQETSSPRKHSIDAQFDAFINHENAHETAERNLEATSSAINSSEDQQAPVDPTRGVHQSDNHTLEDVPRAASPMDQLKYSDVIASRTEMDRAEVPPLSAPIQKGTAQKFGMKRENIEIKAEGAVQVKRAKADVLKQSLLAPSRTRSPPPDTTVGNYLQDLVSFLRKLNRRNEKLDEFIDVMEDIVSQSNKRKQKMSYFDILCAARRLFNSFKNNAVIFGNNTGDISCCYDKTYYFGLKDFLVSLKKFVANYDTILDEFSQLQKDIEDEIQRCNEDEKGGKQELLKIEEIIDRVTSDFDQFGLMKEYKSEVQKREEAKGSCSSNSR